MSVHSITGDRCFRILGTIEVDAGWQRLRVPPGRQQIILGALLLDANRVVGMDQLIDAVWDERPPATARSQIQICVSALRQSLAGPGEAPIVTIAPGYLIRVADNELDLHVFERNLAKADVAQQEGRLAEAVQLLRAALALWRGDALGGGVGSRQLTACAVRLNEQRMTALENCVDLELRLGRHHDLIAELTGLVEEHPLRERLRGQLMLALYRSGRQADALGAYRAGRDVLVDELGLEPSEELQALESAILAGERQVTPTNEPVGPPAGQIVQPRQLPADTADFTGRREPVADLVGWIGGDQGAVPVVVITGMPGVGKSALAVHISHHVADRFPDGQLYVDLRGSQPQPADPVDVLCRFLRALGVPGSAVPEELEERAEMYRSVMADRRVLVVLEDAAAEAQVLPLLPGGPGCAVVVTSRFRLAGLPGARLCEVEVMDQEQSLELLGKVIGRDRIEAEPGVAEALVGTVGGLPLALRVVSARLVARPHWSLAAMMGLLADERHRLDELSHGEIMVRASLALTYEGLSKRSRRLLRLLSLVEAETFLGWIAAALLDEQPARGAHLMESLVDAQMLNVAGVDVAGYPRFKFHDLVRVFARERLTESESRQECQDAVERLVGGWLALAREAHRRLYGGDYTVLHGNGLRWDADPSYVSAALKEPLQWLESEQACLCSAVRQAAATEFDEACWDLAVTAVTLFETRGYFDDWQETHEVALNAVRKAGNSRGVAAVMCSLGSMHLSRRRLAQAELMLEPALELFDELADVHGRALVTRSLGILAYIEGRPVAAAELYDRAQHGFQLAGDRIGEAYVLGRFAQLDIGRTRYDQAIERLRQALEICRETGNTRLEGQLLYRVGRVFLLQGNYEQAEQMLMTVLDMVHATGDVLGESFTLHSLGTVHLHMQELDKAEPILRHALSLRERLRDQFGASRVRLDLAALLTQRGEVREATGLVQEALRVFQSRRLPAWEDKARTALADLSGLSDYPHQGVSPGGIQSLPSGQ
ncbi:DNA-binding SARP family transcriptional activator [Kibdelosporangium banguiense]|uniref:DNA-binding SARP family transcriptional activator n=1 Tax=Kibdelosporangium banguiense TaxID=1365924 RepID=A0ABS4TSB8_9PSEU|nr:BTAD domain-containing putative transcriptional regulator [Kibdelosporangium banguiense]MBP2327303.1 DNA-binding SARP family transcriptional activator [Kibdelosporangium banguiense]